MSSTFKKIILSSAIISAAALSSGTATAAGFYIQEQSVKGLGYAFAGSSTSIDDASTIYFNPAGMTRLDGAQVNAGVHLLLPSADLDDTGTTIPPFAGAVVGTEDGGNPYSPSPVPNLFAAMPIMDDQTWVGIGITAPFGLGSDYGEDWFGRYDSTETELMTINIQPSIARQVTDWLSIGGGIDIQYADADLQSIAAAPGVGEGVSTLKGDDWSIGYNIGFLAEVNPKTDVAVHYRSAMSHELDGKISFEGLTSALGDFEEGGGADLNLPDIATFGVAHDLNDQTRLMAQATWFGWNNFDEIAAERDSGTPVAPIEQNYQTTWAFAVGAEHDLNETWTVRAGYQYDATPTTNEFRTSRTPDGDRHWFSGGATYKLNDKIDLDFAATYINVDDGTIDVTRNAGFANVQADTDGYVGIVAAGINYKF